MSVLKALAQRKHLLFALPALILIFGLTFTTYNVKGFSLTKSIASAATCSGTGCNNTDPQATGCANDGSTVLWASIGWNGYEAGELDMRWSNACQTNWTRIVMFDNSYGVSYTARLYYIPGNCSAYYHNWWIGTQSTWTGQFYAPTAPVESYGTIYDPNGWGIQRFANPGWGGLC